MQLTGTFQITGWDETTEQTFDNGAKLNIASVKQAYTGAIQGNSEIKYIMYYHPSGNADFAGFEYIKAQINGQETGLTLKHDGKFENGVASSHFLIVQSSNDESLIGKTGEFTSGEAGKADYKID